jgi:AcrR family transcriptional regulator
MSTRIPKPRANMRKEPRQARSRATVEAIIQAGAHVLGDQGWSGFTTNEVADVAGVSIGSLYQYFPNKLALIEAIRRKHFDDVLAVLQQAGESRNSPEQLVDDLVHGMISVHCINPALHRVLLDLPNLEGSRSAYDEFHAEYLRRYRVVITAHRNRRGGAADGFAAQVLSSAVEGVIHNAARRGTLKLPELKQELRKLVCCYLSRATLSGSS